MRTVYWRDRARLDSGATMIEYALMVSLIAIAITVSASLLGFGLSDRLVDVADAVSGQTQPPPGGGGGGGGGNNGGNNNGQGGGWGGGVGGGQGHN